MEIMNHREMEYESNKLFRLYNIDINEGSFWFDSNDNKANELMKWLKATADEVSIRDIELDYGLDCLRGYLMFEKVPKINDLDMDTWEECSLEGVYKFICKYYRAMTTIFHANMQGKYKQKDFFELRNSLYKCEYECLKLIHMENTMPNRHNVLSLLMDELKLISKECKVAELTVKKHEDEIHHAVANAGISKETEDISNINKELVFICKKYMTLVSPFIPYITEQCWKLYESDSLAIMEKWEYCKIEEEESFSLPVQVNGKTKGVIKVSNALPKEEVKQEAIKFLKNLLSEKEFDCIYIEKKIINFILH